MVMIGDRKHCLVSINNTFVSLCFENLKMPVVLC